MWVRFPPGALLTRNTFENREAKMLKKIDEGKIYSILSYIPFLCFIPLFKSELPEMAKKHVKQGMILLIIEITALIFLIDAVSKAFWSLILIFCLITAFIGIIMAMAGKDWKIPVIGNFLKKYDI